MLDDNQLFILCIEHMFCLPPCFHQCADVSVFQYAYIASGFKQQCMAAVKPRSHK